MNNKVIMLDFINRINNLGLMTEFIMNIFGYKDIFDYNYMFRIIDDGNDLIMDIYDNVSENKFNRYVYSFYDSDYDYKREIGDKLFVHYINIFKIRDIDNNVLRLGYLFSLDMDKMIDYAKIFMNDKFILILDNIIK